MRGRQRRDDGWDGERRDRPDDRYGGGGNGVPEAQSGWGRDEADWDADGYRRGGTGEWAGQRDNPSAGYPVQGYGDTVRAERPRLRAGYRDGVTGAPGGEGPGHGTSDHAAADFGGPRYTSSSGAVPVFSPAPTGMDSQGYARRGRGDAPGYAGRDYDGSGQPGQAYPDAGFRQSRGDGAGYGGDVYNGAGYDSAGYDSAGSGYDNGGYDSGGYGGGRRESRRGESQYGGSPGQDASPTFTPAAAGPSSALAQMVSAGNSRPYGRLSIFTLLDDRTDDFDRLADEIAAEVRELEPETLVFVIHVVPRAPQQRIIYEVYRDRASFESHERQPHIQRFVAERKPYVLATNIIDLRLKNAKISPLQGWSQPVPQSAPAQPSWSPRAVDPEAQPFGTVRHADPADDRYADGGGGWRGRSPEPVARPQFTPAPGRDQAQYPGQRYRG